MSESKVLLILICVVCFMFRIMRYTFNIEKLFENANDVY